MDEAIVGSVAWRRRHSSHSYLGTLSAGDAGLRLEGREPSTGIDLSLSIPFSEIEEVLAPNGSGDLVNGEPAAVLRLTGSEPVLVRELGSDLARTAALAHLLADLVARDPG